MAWNRAPCYATQQIVFKHNVRLVGWPSDIPWDNPMGISSCPKLRRLLDGLEDGQIYFEQLMEAEVDAAARRQHMDARWARMRANREDCVGRRQVRDVETRSKRKMKGKGGIKSPFEVPAGADK